MVHLPWSVLPEGGDVQGQGLHRGCAAAFAGKGEVPLEFYGDKGADIKKKNNQAEFISSAQLLVTSPASRVKHKNSAVFFLL